MTTTLELKNLYYGEEITMEEFDSRMVEEGYQSEYQILQSKDDLPELLESECIVYTTDDEEGNMVKIEFEVIRESEDYEEAIIAVTNVEPWQDEQNSPSQPSKAVRGIFMPTDNKNRLQGQSVRYIIDLCFLQFSSFIFSMAFLASSTVLYSPTYFLL